jgi:amino acid transporter
MIYTLPITCGVLLALFSFKENAFLQLASMGALIGLFVSFIKTLIHAKRHWRQKRWVALVPLLITVLCCGGLELGILARNAYFLTQLPHLEKAIRSFETTGSFPDVNWHGYGAHANEWNGETYVTFWWGSGFPVKHTVLLYSSADNIKAYCKANGRYSGVEFEGKWWIVKD